MDEIELYFSPYSTMRPMPVPISNMLMYIIRHQYLIPIQLDSPPSANASNYVQIPNYELAKHHIQHLYPSQLVPYFSIVP